MFTINATTIPSTFYTESKEFYQKVVDKQKESIGFSKPTSEA
ncbi:hypothetical protein OAT16_11835 [Prolixibacteraceae bacterium]|nr:hypothetical protein [Prolixibacteraceae bacterium]